MRQELDRRLQASSDIQGHLQYLHDAVIEHRLPGQPVTVAEFGVRSGNSTCAFLAALEVVPGTLWSVDLSWPQVPDEWHQLSHWKFMPGADLAHPVIAWVPDRLDVLFIDTSHWFEHTLAELGTYAPRVRPGGVILMHDTEHGGHYPDMAQPQPDFPVRAAIEKYCAENELSWENRPGSWGLGVIRK